MLPTEDLFVYVYVLIHDLIAGGAITVPPRPGPAPACSDAELLAIVVVRHLLGRRSEAGFPGNDLAARFGRDAAHAEWFYGFRLAARTDLGSRLVRTWSIVPAAVSERDVAVDLLEAGPAPRDLLADKGFSGRGFAAAQAAHGTAVLVPPGRKERDAMPSALLKVIAEWRNRIETTFSEITDRMEVARHGAHTFWGLLTRAAATIATHTLLRVCLNQR
ncbi:MAG: Mobile element protein [Actinomycetia bacterium]|nr:Mobile element protein [Actinomycetes bacterium]